jgi:peptidoglycan/LPS O-acetylase OafA/YrhL
MALLKLELDPPVTGRLQVVDELKGLAIIMVVAYHFCGAMAWDDKIHGDLGVDIFMVLSGVALAFGARYDNAASFLKRRLVRIMPTYWIVLTIYVFCNIHFLQLHYSPFDLFVHYLGMQGFFGDAYGMGINDSFWFMTLILSCYLLFCACHSLIKTPDRLLLVGMAISAAVTLGFFYTGQGGMFKHLGLRLPGFFVGIVIGQLMKVGRLDLKLAWRLALALLVLTYVPYVQGVIFYTTIVAFSLMGLYVFGWRALAPGAVQAPVARVLKFLGDHSLEIFLIHQPLMRQYNSYLHAVWFNDPQPTLTSFAVGMLIALAVTVIVSVELHRLARRFLPGTPAPA